VDVDFDNDDFFNSFEPTKKEEPKVTKLTEVEDPF